MIKGTEHAILPPPGIRILYEGNFDFDKMKAAVKAWFRSKKYIFTEKEYTIKDKALGKEVEITWIGERKRDDYARFRITIDIKINEMKKSGKLDNGRIFANFAAVIELDYKKRFESKIGEYLRHVYNNYIIKKTINEKYEVELRGELKEVHDIMKDLLELYS